MYNTVNGYASTAQLVATFEHLRVP